MSLHKFEYVSHVAVSEGIAKVRHFLYHPRELGETEVKAADETLVTRADRSSGEVMAQVFRQCHPGVALKGEDSVADSEAGRYRILFDPLDGTLPFNCGTPTSTVIAAV